MKPLIIMGNGPSLKNVDFNLLSDQDTFGLNGAYLKFQEMNWFPKYYGMFIMGPNMWEPSSVENFVKSNYIKIDKFFFFKDYNFGLADLDRVQVIQKNTCEIVSYDESRFSPPFNTIIPTLLQMIANCYTSSRYTTRKGELNLNSLLEKCLSHVRFLNKELFYTLNMKGWEKVIRTVLEIPKTHATENTLEKEDYLMNPRYRVYWTLPKQLSNFFYFGGSSPYIASLIGYTMGYDKIILLGVDNKWTLDPNTDVNTKESYWFENYFSGLTYNVKKIYCPTCDTKEIEAMHIKFWTGLKEAIEVNHANLDVVNCTPNTNLDVFRKSTLEKELA